MFRSFGVFLSQPRGCIGRHGHRRGFGARLGGAIGGSDFGWHGFRAGRKLGADDLQLLILALLAEKPAHGYEIIKALGERSGGFYSPSPGMVYPALTYLEEIGQASVEADGTRKLYRITEVGRNHLEANRNTVDTILAQLKWVGAKMEHVRRAFSGDGEPQEGMSTELREARSRLRASLVAKRGASDEEQRRIAEILKRAADEIG
jgi:DNA-binding PadR family transcriptional regulator